MATNTKEIGFEEYIEKQLVDANGYRKQSNQLYLKNLCLDPEIVLEFLDATQPESVGKLLEIHGEELNEHLFGRLTDEVKTRGALDVFRNGFTDHGVNFKMAYFPPNSGMNEETRKLYEANILSVMRQVHYSEKNPDLSIDTVIFLNGLPIFTIELKNQLSGQTVRNAIQQYRTDRDHKEPLLAFKRCLAHFAVDADQAYMTTKLAGLKTYFLPFNKGYNSGSGNPPNDRGYKTAYLWEDVWTKLSILELIGKFITLQKLKSTDEKGKETTKEALVFPRYHQRDTVQRLLVDAKENGAGRNYLIQHSAGSGKSNTIGWAAHRLSELHNSDDEKVFDTVLVITDRRVLDRQLRDTVTQFEQRAGVVKAITEGSQELKDALETGEKIVITTLQKFPFIVDSIGNLPGKNFAVIIDEAHSSQTGEGAANLREALTTSSLDEAAQQDAEEPETTEEMILKKLRSRKVKTDNISFFAFTATPKQKTLELFGTKSPIDGKYYPFSLYSMKQAIEERFILDVLKNYTTYQAYFSLLKKIEDDPEFDKKKAQRLLIGYVEKHEHAIQKKVEIMAEHFRARIAKEIHGKAKAMIVTKSRLHAVRYKIAMDAYLREHNYPYKALVAFSGTVKDGIMVEYTEGGMNGVPEATTAKTFEQNEYKFLIVAEKFQTGFDQPLLASMYVDKKLSGVSAVQTLSRLNRTTSDKDEVFVLDFVNDAGDIQESFQPYYTTTVLSEGTDPNILHDLERDLYSFKLFTQHEVDGFVQELFHNAPPAMINAILDATVQQFNDCLPQEQEDFRKKCTDFVRRYAFASQIIPYESSELEKLYTFTRLLLKKLPRIKEELPTEVLDSVDMESYKIVHRGQDAIRLEDEQGSLEPMQSGTRSEEVKEQDRLSKIITDINDRFGTEFTLEDVVITNQLGERLANNPMLQGSIKNNARDTAKIKFDEVLGQELVEMLNRHFDFYKKLDKNPDLKAYFGEKMFDHVVKSVNESK